MNADFINPLFIRCTGDETEMSVSESSESEESDETEMSVSESSKDGVPRPAATVRPDGFVRPTSLPPRPETDRGRGRRPGFGGHLEGIERPVEEFIRPTSLPQRPDGRRPGNGRRPSRPDGMSFSILAYCIQKYANTYMQCTRHFASSSKQFVAQNVNADFINPSFIRCTGDETEMSVSESSESEKSDETEMSVSESSKDGVPRPAATVRPDGFVRPTSLPPRPETDRGRGRRPGFGGHLEGIERPVEGFVRPTSLPQRPDGRRPGNGRRPSRPDGMSFSMLAYCIQKYANTYMQCTRHFASSSKQFVAQNVRC